MIEMDYEKISKIIRYAMYVVLLQLFILDIISTELALQTANIYGFSLYESNWLMKPIVENLLVSYGLKFIFFILILLKCEQSIELRKKTSTLL